MNLPACETLLLNQEKHNLYVTLNRPKTRNAMSLTMVHELMALFESVKENLSIRCIILRGSEGHFCAGGDVKDMANARANAQNSDEDPFYTLNREFGRMLTVANQLPQTVIAVLEGAVLGGGFGLACVSDVAIAMNNAKFGLPETGLGIPPAQIAPFVVRRIGLTQTRRLALLGIRFDGNEAKELGIVHYVANDIDDLENILNTTLAHIQKCAPLANAVTKELILNVGNIELETLLDQAAEKFSQAIQGPEGTEGTIAFMQKRPAKWAE